MSSRLEDLVAARVAALPRGLREHISRVQQLAFELGHHHGADQEKVRLGALAHDIARAMKGEELLGHARRLGIPVHPVEARVPLLLHGPVAAELFRSAGGLDDPEIYEAVYWHSTAHMGMGPTAKIVFLADKLDPQKAGRYPYLDELKDMATRDLDTAILEFLSRELVALLSQGGLVHPASVDARNELLMAVS